MAEKSQKTDGKNQKLPQAGPQAPGGGEDDLLLQTARPAGPALWIAIIFIPVLFAVYSNLAAPKAPPQEKPPVTAGTETTAAPVRAPDPGRAATRPIAGSNSKSGYSGMLKCVFKEWMNQRAADVEPQIKILHRPYRFLLPGAVMTMDHNPERLNFELDENGIIRRSWCG